MLLELSCVIPLKRSYAFKNIKKNTYNGKVELIVAVVL